MWLSKKLSRAAEKEPPTAQSGEATRTESELGVFANGERRGVSVYGPAGFRWQPKPGDGVLIIKDGDDRAVAGVAVAPPANPGDLELVCDGGAVVALRRDGSISLKNGDGAVVELNGTRISITSGGAEAHFSENGFQIVGTGGGISMSGASMNLSGVVTVNGARVMTEGG